MMRKWSSSFLSFFYRQIILPIISFVGPWLQHSSLKMAF